MKRRILLQTALLGAAGMSLPRIAASAAAAPIIEDQTWTDAGRKRALPVRLRWPAEGLPVPEDGRPLVIFSHGLGGTRAGGAVWGQAWAAAGFVVLHLQHPGSDFDAVRAEVARVGVRGGLSETASARQLLARLGDVGFALDQVARLKADRSARWADVRVSRVGMSGHSFGAHTTLGMAGQSYPGFKGVNETRLAAFIAFSPSAPQVTPRQALAAVTRPTLCVTGTRDDDVIGNGATPQQRQATYAALPEGHKAMLLLADADHMTFGGLPERPVMPRRAAVTLAAEARHHALVAAITSDWWRAHLLDDRNAAQRLLQPAGLAPDDRWHTG